MCKIVLLIGGIVVRRVLIQSLGNEINGLNSLYLNIIDVLAVAELGVGEAITYCMYRPVVEKDTWKVSALYRLFHRLYLLIALVILAAGICVLPFLPRLAGEVNEDLSLTFLLTLLSVCITYFFGARTALINAHKNNYITTAISSSGKLAQYLLQITVLLTTRSYPGFLISRTVTALVQWAAVKLYTDRHYKDILNCKGVLDAQTSRIIRKNIGAMFLHKIGAVAVNATDGILISIFVGVAVLGKYSNYLAIMTAMTGLLGLLFSSLTSVVGHLYVEKKESIREYFDFFHRLNHALGILFFLGYYAVIDPLVTMLFGSGLLLPKTVTMVLTVNYYIQFTRKATLLFRDATGAFYNDRWKPLAESAVNLAVSVILANHLGVTGVLLGTVITNLLICNIVEPLVLHRYILKQPVGKHYLRHYGCILLFAAALLLLDHFLLPTDGIKALLLNGGISILLSAAIIPVLLIRRKK